MVQLHTSGRTTYAGILLSRNSTKSGRYMILVYDVTPGVRCSGACPTRHTLHPLHTDPTPPTHPTDPTPPTPYTLIKLLQ